MLSSIYEKFQNVQDEISSRGLATGEPLPKKYNKHLNAGCRTLSDFQDEWSIIHAGNEVNATIAKDIDRKITSLQMSVNKKKDTWEKFTSQLESLETLIAATESVVNTIGKLRMDITGIEEDLIALENLIEIEEFQKNQMKERSKLAKYRECKLRELDCFRANLSEEHSTKLRKKEELETLVNNVKHDIYGEKFEEDMKAYKENGVLPLPKTRVSSLKVLGGTDDIERTSFENIALNGEMIDLQKQNDS